MSSMFVGSMGFKKHLDVVRVTDDDLAFRWNFNCSMSWELWKMATPKSPLAFRVSLVRIITLWNDKPSLSIFLRIDTLWRLNPKWIEWVQVIDFKTRMISFLTWIQNTRPDDLHRCHTLRQNWSMPTTRRSYYCSWFSSACKRCREWNDPKAT